MKFRKKSVVVVCEPQYVPFKVGLPKAGSQNHVEFLIIGRNQRDNQNKVLQFFTLSNPKLVSHFSCAADDDYAYFSMSCIVDCSETKYSPTDLLIAIRKLKFVARAEMQEMTNKLFSNFVFPVSLMKNKNTSVIIDTITLFEILRTSANREEVGKKYALNVIESIRAPMAVIRSESAKSAQGAFAETIKNYFRACGWGQLSFDAHNDRDGDLFDVSTVVISKIPETQAGQKEMEGEDGLSSPWVGFFKGFVSGVLQSIAPENDGNKVVGLSFNKYERTLTLLVSNNNEASETEIALVHDVDEEAPIRQKIKENLVSRRDAIERPSDIQLAGSEEKIPDPQLSSTLSTKQFIPIVLDGARDDNQRSAESPPEESSPICEEKVRQILVTAKRESTVLKIMNKLRITYSHAIMYLDLLKSLELLEVRTSDADLEVVTFKTTEKGTEYIKSKGANHLIDFSRPKPNGKRPISDYEVPESWQEDSF